MLTLDEAVQTVHLALVNADFIPQTAIDIRLIEDKTVADDHIDRHRLAVSVVMNPEEEVQFVVQDSIPNSQDLTKGIFSLWALGFFRGILAFANRLAEESMEPDSPRLH